MAHSLLRCFEPDRNEFPSDLDQPAPMQRSLPRAGWLLALLVLAAFVPRAWMAWKVDILTEDGPLYIYSAMQLERGDLEAAFRHCNLGLNLYPPVLLGLHKLGIPWESTGRVWGTLLAALVVLPLFGWVRRQFGDRIATVACLLYAGHAGLIERSPEMLRCPTFWFLLVATVYFLWRAVVEVRPVLFLLAGLCFTLGAHFRVEAWFLLAPWAIWTIGRWRALHECRGRLLAGACLGLLMLPLFGFLLNVTWLRHHHQWEWCFSHRAAQALAMVAPAPPPTPPLEAAGTTQTLTPAPTPTSASQPVAFSALGGGNHSPRSVVQIVRGYADKLFDALEPLLAVLLGIGLWHGRHMLLRCDQLGMLALCVLCLAGVAAFWLVVHEIQGRYFFPIVLASVNYAALGLFVTGNTLWELGRRFAQLPVPTLAANNVAVLATLSVVGYADALTTRFDDRQIRRELGQWVAEVMGPGQAIMGSDPRGWTVAWYANGRYYGPAVEQFGGPEYLDQTRTSRPDVVLVMPRGRAKGNSPWHEQFRADAELISQYQQVPAEHLPAGATSALVYVRTPAYPRVVRRP